MKKTSPSHRSVAAQVMWAIFIVLVALWGIAYAAHWSGGLITYLLLISAVILFLRSASSRNRAALRARREEVSPPGEAA